MGAIADYHQLKADGIIDDKGMFHPEKVGTIVLQRKALLLKSLVHALTTDLKKGKQVIRKADQFFFIIGNKLRKLDTLIISELITRGNLCKRSEIRGVIYYNYIP
jgi:hypothetical protein